jgi:hypothetical protein
MAQADSKNSITAPVVSTRRSFLSNAAGLAAVGTALALATIKPAPVAAAPREALDGSKASPALRTAFTALDEANDRLTAAQARFTADDLKMVEWRANNPGPAERRAKKRHWRKWREMQDAIVGKSWDAQLEAERDFRKCQMAVANVTPRDEDDLLFKAAIAAIYDKVKVGYECTALISYSVMFDLFKLRMAAA